MFTASEENRKAIRPLAQRYVLCDVNFIAMLQELLGLSGDDAEFIFGLYRTKKVIKRDTCNMTWTVKHGLFLDAATVAKIIKDFRK